jgi:hypothetical protein
MANKKRKRNKFPALTYRIVGKTSEGRDIYENELDEEGRPSVSSERSTTFCFGKGNAECYNYPTIFGGVEHTPDEAVEIFKKNKGVDPETGIKAQKFASEEEALEAAEKRSPGLGNMKERNFKDPLFPDRFGF